MSATRSSTRRLPASRGRTVSPVYSLRRERDTKRRGELAELVFLLIATRMGFAVSKPYGDNERYDFIVDSHRQLLCHPEEGGCPTVRDFRGVGTFGGANQGQAGGKNGRAASILCPRPPLWRIQVKASTQLLNGLYRVNAHRRSGGRAVPYRIGEIDFIAAYIIPEDTWYIIPLHAVRGTSLLFRRKKDRRPGLYDRYKEAWHLLRPKL
jgi:PD-(D/E)XK endonuclease